MEGDTDSNMDEEQSPRERKEGDTKCFHLFNCDKTYKLDAVEKLLNRVNAITDKQRFHISIATPKYFALFEMTELCKTIQSEPAMDFAIFVVHAHESRLSINEDNAGIGYARFYRALLEKTDNKVIVVIGGDDNYKNAAEEEKAVLSRWAKRQISSQFKEEFMDGRISFIFSWDKEHRPIHEEAMLHFLDPGKKGEKFEPKLQPSKPAVGATEAREISSNESLGADVNTDTAINYSNVKPLEDESVERQRAEAEHSQKNVLINQSATSEKSNVVEPGQVTPAGTSGHCAGVTPESTCIKHSEALAKDAPSQEKITAILCRDQSDIAIIRDVFGEQVLDILHIFSGPPDAGPRSILSFHSMWSCVIVADARTMRDELSAGTIYKDLLNTAREKVERKVVIIICSDKGTVIQNEEHALTNQISLLLGDKGVVLWWKGNETVPHQTQNPKPPKRPLVRSQSVPDYDEGKRSVALSEARPIDPLKYTLLLKTRLHRGKISYQKEDVEQRLEGWTAPEYIANDLMKKKKSTIDADLKIYQENNTNKYHVVVNDRKDSKTGSRIANSVKDAIETVGDWWSAQTDPNNFLYNTI